MNSRALLIVFCLTFALTACGGAQSGFTSPSVSPLEDRAITTQSAQVTTTNVKQPIHQTVVVPCANNGRGETVVLSGTLHMVMSTTVTANNAHVMMSNNPQGVTGVGTVTGDIYHANGNTRQGENVANGFFPENITFVNNFHIIGGGAAVNLLVHQTSHITVNANRTITVNNVTLRIVCQ